MSSGVFTMSVVALEERDQAVRSAVYQGVQELLEREVAKSKDNGDLVTAEIYELISAKVRGLEKYAGK